MTVYETDVPGVGKKFELDVGDGARAVVVLHHDGHVELFRRDSPDADSTKLLDLSNQQANYLGSILEGAYFETVDLDELTVPLGGDIIGWIEVGADSPIAGSSLADADVRAETGVSVIALQREGTTEPNPGPETVVEAGDVLVVIGTREEKAALTRLVEND